MSRHGLSAFNPTQTLHLPLLLPITNGVYLMSLHISKLNSFESCVMRRSLILCVPTSVVFNGSMDRTFVLIIYMQRVCLYLIGAADCMRSAAQCTVCKCRLHTIYISNKTNTVPLPQFYTRWRMRNGFAQGMSAMGAAVAAHRQRRAWDEHLYISCRALAKVADTPTATRRCDCPVAMPASSDAGGGCAQRIYTHCALLCYIYVIP